MQRFRYLDFFPAAARADAAFVASLGAVVGLFFGLAAAYAATALPRIYGLAGLEDANATARPRALTPRNGFVVALVTTLGVALSLRAASTAAFSLSAPRVLFEVAFDLALCAGLITAAIIDFEHMILPNEITLGGAVLALATAPWRHLGFTNAALGVLVGLALTYVPAAFYARLRGHSGVGGGDIKLVALAGAWLGLEGVMFMVLAGAVQSFVASLFMNAFGLSYAIPASVQAELAALRAEAEAGDEVAQALLASDPMAAPVDVDKPGAATLGTLRLPFGPPLVLACLEFVVLREFVMHAFGF